MEKQFRYDGYTDDRKLFPITVVVTLRWDYRCGNGHNTFGVSGEIFECNYLKGEPYIIHDNGMKLWLHSCGQIAGIETYFPDLADALPFHLFDERGPLHYIPNTLYRAGDKDCWGLRKGELEQFRSKTSGLPLWTYVPHAKMEDGNWKRGYLGDLVASATQPPDYESELLKIVWEPWGRLGEGKEREFEYARKSACWPEATDEELSLDSNVLRILLEERLPALMERFHAMLKKYGLEE